MLSRIMARFSSALVRRTSVTWKSELLPTMVIVLARESKQRPQALVVRGLHALAAGHAEGADADVLQRQFADPLEVLRILFIRGRVAALDIVDAEAVEPLGDGQLVLQREADAFGLRAVAEGRVVDLDAGHNRFSTEIWRAEI